jgi:hypothetical protein
LLRVPQDVYEKYSRMLYRSFIELNVDVKWCPNPKGCSRAVKCGRFSAILQLLIVALTDGCSGVGTKASDRR